MSLTVLREQLVFSVFSVFNVFNIFGVLVLYRLERALTRSAYREEEEKEKE